LLPSHVSTHLKFGSHRQKASVWFLASLCDCHNFYMHCSMAGVAAKRLATNYGAEPAVVAGFGHLPNNP